MIVDLFSIIFVNGVYDFSRHKGFGVPLEDAQAGARAKVNPLAAVRGAGIIGRIFEFAAASGFILRLVLALINAVVH